MVDARLELKMGKATRDAFGEALREIGKSDQRIVVVDGDVNNSTRTEWFAKEAPGRFFNMGIAESNMVGIAAGMAACGKISFVASFAVFLWANAFDQIRMNVGFQHENPLGAKPTERFTHRGDAGVQPSRNLGRGGTSTRSSEVVVHSHLHFEIKVQWPPASTATESSPKRNAVRLEPAKRDYLKRRLPKPEPLFFDAQASDRATKTPERARTVNGVQQLIPPSLAHLAVREALHDRPFVDLELVWQRQEVVRFQRRAHAG